MIYKHLAYYEAKLNTIKHNYREAVKHRNTKLANLWLRAEKTVRANIADMLKNDEQITPDNY